MILSEITFHELDGSDALKSRIERRIKRLEHFYNRITKCHVVISQPHRHRHHGRLFRVEVEISLPRKHVVVSHNHEQKEGHRDPYVAVRDAFHSAERILEDLVRVRRDRR